MFDKMTHHVSDFRTGNPPILMGYLIVFSTTENK